MKTLYQAGCAQTIAVIESEQAGVSVSKDPRYAHTHSKKICCCEHYLDKLLN